MVIDRKPVKRYILQVFRGVIDFLMYNLGSIDE